MLTPKQIIAYQQIDGIGNTKVFQLCEYAIQKRIELNSTADMLGYIQECIDRKIIKKYSPKKYGCITLSTMEEAVSKAEAITEKSYREGIGILSFYDRMFPEQLKHVTDEEGKSANPLVIYYKGNLSALPQYGIAIIGTRKPTSEGIQAGEFFAERFAGRGCNIISGLAVGCDTSAHRGALNANGFTTAFLAHGLDKIYPKGNDKLAGEIIGKGGLLMSEYPVGTQPIASYFVARDRLQSGMANATVVIQTGIKGGTMHAVASTISARKPLYAVNYKGNLNDLENVKGNTMLVRDKLAIPLSSSDIDTVLERIKQPLNLT